MPLLVAIALALLFWPSSSKAANTQLCAEVGMNDTFTITLKDATCTTAITHLDPGTYDIVVHDYSTFHNFHLFGPGSVSQATAVETASTVTWTVTFVDGMYRYQCDPHSMQMKGSFTVGTSTRTLTVTKNGSGAGTVTGTGINCGADCSESYASGTSVMLAATPSAGSTFGAWAGCASSSGTTCNVTMDADKTVTATFNTVSPPPPPPPPPSQAVQCVVPRVRGLTLAKAKQRIRAAHCAPGAVRRAYSKKRKAGRVIGQSPAPGARFAQNHAVKLIVSRGPKPKRLRGH